MTCLPKNNPIHVAVGVIINEANEVLIARRSEKSHQGGLWEFPGGKLDIGEAVETALDRELTEELGLSVQSCRPLIKIQHEYSDKYVLLDVWWVDSFAGIAKGREGQPIRWVPASDLQRYRFPEANQDIIFAIHKELLKGQVGDMF